jgi:phosphoglycolate phosphatase
VTSHLVVFDLDGTLVDSMRDLADSTNDALATYAAPPLPVDDVSRMVGDGARQLVARALASAGLDVSLDEAFVRFQAAYDRRLLDATRPYEGIPDVVRAAARQTPLAVLTNKPEAPARRLIEAFGWSASFSWILGGDSGFGRKPDPAGLRYLMEEAGVTAQATLLVGDSNVDVETARRAGVRVCFARYGFGRMRGEVVLEPGEDQAEHPSDIGAVIDRFLERGTS